MFDTTKLKLLHFKNKNKTSREALRFLDIIEFELRRLSVSVPQEPVVFFEPDGAIALEWIRNDCRFGLSFEVDPEKSGWFLVRSVIDSESGLLTCVSFQLPSILRTYFVNVANDELDQKKD